MHMVVAAAPHSGAGLAVGAADGREGRGLHNQPQQPGGTPGNLGGHGMAAIAFWCALLVMRYGPLPRTIPLQSDAFTFVWRCIRRAPDMNLFRDPRWGRAQETMGEDPTLMGQLVVQMVTGAQNNSIGSERGPGGQALRTGMCCKHFAACTWRGMVEESLALPSSYLLLPAVCPQTT